MRFPQDHLLRALRPEFQNSTHCSRRLRQRHQHIVFVSVDDVGVATAFLALDAARLITGDTLYVDGGYHIID